MSFVSQSALPGHHSFYIIFQLREVIPEEKPMADCSLESVIACLRQLLSKKTAD